MRLTAESLLALAYLPALAMGLLGYGARRGPTLPRTTELLATVGSKLSTPATIDSMMVEVGNAVAAFQANPSSSRVGIVELPLPVTGGTELDDWPGGIRQKAQTLSLMLPSTFTTLNFSSSARSISTFLNGESGVEDCVAVWSHENLRLVSFPTPEAIDEIKEMTASNPSIVVCLLNPQFFLDPLSRDDSKSFVAGAEVIYELTQLNMRGEGLSGALPVRGILSRSFPGPFRAGRRLDQGGYVLLKEYAQKPTRAELEVLYLEDSKTRDAGMSLSDQLKRLVPRFD